MPCFQGSLMGFEPILRHPQCLVLPLHHRLHVPASFREAHEILPLDPEGLQVL